MQSIEEVADEGSSFYPRIDFLDEDGAPVTPDTLTWKLTDMQGNVINGRSAVSVSPGGSYVVLALGGDDLLVPVSKDGSMVPRVITCWGTYTSSTHGAGRPYSVQAKFDIQPRVGG